jgi:hypothetical protein
MATTDLDRHMDAEELARGKRMIETTLEGWDLLTWNELLADDVVLSLKLGTLDVSRIGDIRAAGGNLQVFCKQQAKEALQNIYGDLRNGLSVTIEVVSGYDAILLGDLAVGTKDSGIEALPIGIFMAFESHGRIREMMIAAVDVQALTEAIRSAARAGVANAA